jgi:tripartite ATP-independent transporter DctM subunit
MIVGLTFVLLLVLLFINAPVFVAILGSSIFYFVANNSLSWMMVVQRTISGLESIPLLAVPFFVMAGVFMNYTGITSRMIRFAEVLTGHMPGGLAQTNVVLSTLMGGLSGSSLADAAMQSKILVPEMEKRGYGKAFSSAVTGASALITPIIPPGIALIIYGFVGNVSIGRLFLAGVVPGVMTCLFMMVVVHFISKRRGYLPIYERRAGIREVFRAFREASWALFLPVVIVGGIRFGVFTPTEAGSIAILYALVLGTIVYREMTLKDLKTGLIETVTTTASIMLIIAAASSFAWILTWKGCPDHGELGAVHSLKPRDVPFAHQYFPAARGHVHRGKRRHAGAHTHIHAHGAGPGDKRCPLRHGVHLQHGGGIPHAAHGNGDVHHLLHHGGKDRRLHQGVGALLPGAAVLSSADHLHPPDFPVPP